MVLIKSAYNFLHFSRRPYALNLSMNEFCKNIIVSSPFCFQLQTKKAASPVLNRKNGTEQITSIPQFFS
jgi:hypothetical protein